MMWRRPGSYEFTPTNAKARQGTPFWKHLNEHGLRVGLVNVPFTYPPDRVDGFVVGGFGTPDSASDMTYPPEVLPWIEQKFGPYKPTVNAEFLRSAPPSQVLDAEKKHQAHQIQIALALAERYQVDVLVINLMLPDHANHKMPHMDQVQEAYRQSDVDLNHLIQAFRPDNVMLISDHGSSRLKGDFLLNAWLRDQGYYVQAQNVPDDRSDALNWILIQWLQIHHGWSGSTEKMLRRLARDSLLKLPDRIKEQFWNKVENVIPFAREHVLLSSRPDYTRTRLFPGSVYSGLLYFNLVGREPAGVIPFEARETLAAEIAAKLGQIKEPDTGRPLFSNVYSARELYTGPAVESAPDLILDSYDMGWNIRTSKHVPIPERTHNEYFVEATHRRDYGWHSRDGIFVLAGQGFSTGPASGQGHVMDIPATLLHLYGVPIPEDYDGRVLTELMASEFGQQPIRYQPGDVAVAEPIEDAYSAEEAEALVDHLRALGYLD